jgi:hypothetical protein
MDLITLTILLAAAKGRLCRAETGVRKLLGTMSTAEEILDLSEAKRVLEALQQMRIERVFVVHGIQDGLDLPDFPKMTD